MNKIQNVLKTARNENEVRKAEWAAKEIKWRMESGEIDELIREGLCPQLRHADMNDYLKWLSGYIEGGGKPTHVYDYSFSRWKWYVAMRDIEPLHLCGSKAINIIVPADVSVGPGDWGHCNLFYMAGYAVHGIVPIFEDTNFSGE